MCFSLEWLKQLFILLVIIVAVVAILKLLVPYVLAQIGAEVSGALGIVVAVIRIVIWAIIAIAVIYFCFAMISCLFSMGGGSFPLFPRGR